MADETPILSDEQLTELALAPRRVTGDEGTIEERGIDEFRKAKNLIDGGQAVKKPPHGMTISKLVHGPTY